MKKSQKIKKKIQNKSYLDSHANKFSAKKASSKKFKKKKYAKFINFRALITYYPEVRPKYCLY